MYLYAITDRPEMPIPAGPGLEGACLFSLSYRDISAVVSPLAQARVPPTEANLWRHEAVVETLMADRTVLPVRFGTVLTNEAAVQAALAAHYTDFVASLKLVRGRVELGLRVLWDDDPPAPQSPPAPRKRSGRSYLLARLAAERQAQAWRQRAEALATEIDTALTFRTVRSTRRVLVTPRLLLTAAYLVEHDQVPIFRREVERLSVAHPTLHFLCTGPWPPYSFVTADRTALDFLRFLGQGPGGAENANASF
jgi:hypothetical protein